MKYLITTMAMLAAAFALQSHAQSIMLPELTGEYGRGFCDAVKALMRNRDHYRQLSHFPAETMEESMKRIYETWPPKAPKGYENDQIVKMQVLEMAGIDLYVMLPPQLCEGK